MTASFCKSIRSFENGGLFVDVFRYSGSEWLFNQEINQNDISKHFRADICDTANNSLLLSDGVELAVISLLDGDWILEKLIILEQYPKEYCDRNQEFLLINEKCFCLNNYSVEIFNYKGENRPQTNQLIYRYQICLIAVEI